MRRWFPYFFKESNFQWNQIIIIIVVSCRVCQTVYHHLTFVSTQAKVRNNGRAFFVQGGHEVDNQEFCPERHRHLQLCQYKLFRQK